MEEDEEGEEVGFSTLAALFNIVQTIEGVDSAVSQLLSLLIMTLCRVSPSYRLALCEKLALILEEVKKERFEDDEDIHSFLIDLIKRADESPGR